MNEKKNFDYKRLHPFKWYILENFPFLEDSIDVLTNYQLFCKLGEMYNKEVNAINTLGIQVEGLTDWFDDLDVQDEINNKLDDMAESGELEEIIGAYINANAILAFDTLADLKNATNLINGSYAKTLGYYSINDGGGATYKIRTITNEDIVNNMDIISIVNNNTLIAELISDKNNIMCYGVEKNDTNNNNHTIISYVLNKMNYAYCKEEIDLKNELVLTGQNKKFTFNKINYLNNTGATITIHDTINYIINGVEIVSNSNGIRLGLTELTSGVQLNIGRIIAEKNSIYLGGALGVLDSQIYCNRLEYKEHGVFLDLSQKWVGQIGFYNMLFADNSSLQENYAVYGNCSSFPCTGLDFYNISLEGAKGGFNFETTHATNFIEHLNIYGCRLAEFSLNNHYKAIKFVSSPTSSNINIKGVFEFDEAYIDSFDVSNFNALLDNAFILKGIIRTTNTANNYGLSTLGKQAFIGCGIILIDKPYLQYIHNFATAETTLYGSVDLVLLNQRNYSNPVYNIKLTDTNIGFIGKRTFFAQTNCTVNFINNDGTIASTYTLTPVQTLIVECKYLRSSKGVEIVSYVKDAGRVRSIT